MRTDNEGGVTYVSSPTDLGAVTKLAFVRCQPGPSVNDGQLSPSLRDTRMWRRRWMASVAERDTAEINFYQPQGVSGLLVVWSMFGEGCYPTRSHLAAFIFFHFLQTVTADCSCYPHTHINRTGFA